MQRLSQNASDPAAQRNRQVNSGRWPWASRAWRRLLHHGIELLTLCIRHPRTVGRIGALLSAAHMRRQLPDPELRRRAWPDYPFGCKRVLLSSDFLPALGRPNVQLVTDRIARMTPQKVWHHLQL